MTKNGKNEGCLFFFCVEKLVLKKMMRKKLIMLLLFFFGICFSVLVFILLYNQTLDDEPKIYKIHQTRVFIRATGCSVQTFKRDFGRFPSSKEGLAILNNGEAKGRYFEELINWKDFWNNQLIYKYPSKNPKYLFELYSVGPNGIDEHMQGDDISFIGCR
jgi:hypothetical protein